MKKSVTQHTRADGQKQSVNRAGGKFDDNGASAAGAAASAFDESSKPTFEEIQGTPLEEDLAEGRARGRNALLRTVGHRWTDIMGYDVRKTKKNREEFDRRLDELVEQRDEARIARDGRSARMAHLNSYGRAYEQGIDIDPAEEEIFEQRWADAKSAYGESETTSRLNQNRDLLGKLERDEIPPGHVTRPVGTTNPKKVAREWLEGQIAGDERAIATRGRSIMDNVNSVDWRLRGSS